MLDMKIEVDASGPTEPWHGQRSNDSFLERPRRRRRARFRALTMMPSNNSDEEDEYFEDNGLLYQLMETLGSRPEWKMDSVSSDLVSRNSRLSDNSQRDIRKRVLSLDHYRNKEPMFNGDFDTVHSRLGRLLMKDIFGRRPTRKSVKQRHYNDIQLLELGFPEDLGIEELSVENKETHIPTAEEKETIEVDDHWLNLNSSFTKFRNEFASLENPRNSKLLQRALRRQSKSDTRRQEKKSSRRKAVNSDNTLPVLGFVENTTLTTMLTEINSRRSSENKKKKNGKFCKSKTVNSFFQFPNYPTQNPTREQRQNRIPRPDNKRYVDLHIRSIHKKFNRPLPEIRLQQMKKLGVRDIRQGDVIFIVDYEEPEKLTSLVNSTISSKRQHSTEISNSKISKSKLGSDLLSFPDEFLLDLPGLSSKKKLLTNISESESTDSEKYVESSDNIRARHVMVCTNTSLVKNVIEAAHVTTRRARVSTLKPPVSPTELELQTRLSFVQMGMNQRGVLPLCYKALVYRLSGYPQCASEIATVASKFIKTGRIIPRVIDVDKVFTEHADGFLKKSPRSLFRAPVREEFDNCGRFVNLYSNEFMILSVQRALYKMFKAKATSFENIRNILDLDPINPWPSVSHSYMQEQKDWTIVGLLDFQFQ
jgi:hypothetical protein